MQHYQRIRDLREDSDLTQKQLCEKLYMHKTTYVNYEQGKRCIPFDLAVTLADFYHVSLDYLAGRTKYKHSYSIPHLSKEEINLIEQYRNLTERGKGRVEQLVEMLLENQDK